MATYPTPSTLDGVAFLPLLDMRGPHVVTATHQVFQVEGFVGVGWVGARRDRVQRHVQPEAPQQVRQVDGPHAAEITMNQKEGIQ